MPTVYRIRHKLTGALMQTRYATMTGALLCLAGQSPYTQDEYEVVQESVTQLEFEKIRAEAA